jgi:4-carboxymuconolactone decarboxylase
MARLAPIDLEKLSAEQRAVADAILAGPRGGLRGPFEPWLRSPSFADPAQKLGEQVRFRSSLPEDLKELAIIITGAHWKAQFEFWAHARMARAAGIAPEAVDAIRTGKRPPLASDRERVVYDFVTEYLRTNRVSDQTYAGAMATLGERGVVDLVGVVGYYGLVSMTLNVFEIDVPDGEQKPFD